MTNKQHAFLLDEFQVYEAFMRLLETPPGQTSMSYDSRSDEKATSIEIMNVIAFVFAMPLVKMKLMVNFYMQLD